jgi:hypothetical protein
MENNACKVVDETVVEGFQIMDEVLSGWFRVFERNMDDRIGAEGVRLRGAGEFAWQLRTTSLDYSIP